MVAINVDSLHAQRTGGLLVEDGNPQSVIHRGAEGSRLENGVEAVVARGEGGDEAAGVRLGKALKALRLTRLVGCFHLPHKLGVHCLVELERGH